MGEICIINEYEQEIELENDLKYHLELLKLDITFDFKLGEITFFYDDGASFVIDFDENLTIQLVKDVEIDDNLVNDVEDDYFEELELLQDNLKTDAFTYGQGFYQDFFIKIYDKYLVFHNILIDYGNFDFDPDPDPDDGEPLPVPAGGLFFCLKNKKMIK